MLILILMAMSALMRTLTITVIRLFVGLVDCWFVSCPVIWGFACGTLHKRHGMPRGFVVIFVQTCVQWRGVPWFLHALHLLRIAMFCIVGAYKAASASVIAPMQYSQILWAGFFGFLFFGDQISFSFLGGAGLIILSGLYIVKREWDQGRSLKPVLSNGTFRPDIGLRPRFALFEFFKKIRPKRGH